MFYVSTSRKSQIALFCLVIGLWAGNSYADSNPETAQLIKEKKWTQIISKLSSKIESLNRDDLFLLGRAQAENGQQLLAIKTYEVALAKNPKDVGAKRMIGLQYISLGKEKEAMTAFREALAVNPQYEPAYLEIAKLYDRRTYQIKAHESKDITYEQRLLYQDLILQKNVGRKPPYITKLCELTTLAGHYLKKGGSLEYCPEGIAKTPQEPMNYIYLAMTYKETGEAAKANEYFKKAADSFSKSEVAQYSMATYQQEEKNFLLAFKYFKQGTEADPKSVRSLLGLAAAALEIQKPADAYSALEKACPLDRAAFIQSRKAAATLRTQKNQEWAAKFESLSDSCQQIKK